MSRHIFIDETKQRDYLLVATVHASGDLAELRALMQGLVLKGQRRVHMSKESAPRRRVIADTICRAGVSAAVYNAGRVHRSELDARAACLRAVIDHIGREEETMLVLEQDDSLLDFDRRQLYTLTHNAQLPLLRYEHRRASTEQLLAIPDAIAWCWAKGGEWRRRVDAAVTDVHTI